MRARYLVLKILLVLLFLCIAQKDSFAWFHSSGNCENHPFFEPLRKSEHVYKSYTVLPNRPNADSGIRIYDAFPENLPQPSAGELKIDIPFNLLSASTTNVQALLDRQVAANLRLKNLLEQYLAQQKKNAEILQDLKIPYLEAKGTTQKQAVQANSTETLKPADELKRKIAEELIFQTGSKDRRELQDNPNFKSALSEKKDMGNIVPDLEIYEKTNLSDAYLKNRREIGPYNGNDGRDTELPGIFILGMKLLRCLTNNKIEILFWATGMAVIGLVGTIVVKR